MLPYDCVALSLTVLLPNLNQTLLSVHPLFIWARDMNVRTRSDW